jgi:glycosyltransferase involved in cell wall biosynthesis
MRVCLVSREVAPFVAGGGIATYTPLMARGLVASGHEVHILTAAHENFHARIPVDLAGVAWHSATECGGGGEGGAQAGLEGWPSEMLRHSMAVYRELKRLHARHRFDWVEFPDYNGEGYWSVRAKRSLGEFADTTLAVRTHMPDSICVDIDLASRASRERSVVWHMERMSVAEADVLTSPSRAMLERTLEYVGDDALPDGVQPRFVIANPLDVGRSLEALGGEAIDPPAGPGKQTVLCVGRTQMVKGVTLLVDAGRRLLAQGLDLNFHFIGGDTHTSPSGGPMKPYLENMVPACFRDRFTFEGFRPRGALARAIRSATVCCYPSLFESFSMACVEAMSLGAAVVGSNSGGIGEIIEHEVNGLLFEPGSVPSLEASLVRLLRDEPLRRRLGAAAPARVRELCDPERVASQVVEVAEYCLGRVAHRAGASEHAPEPPETRHVADRPPGRRPIPPVHAGPAPRFAVMVPFFNAAATVGPALESLRSQTFRDFELFIVDDGSTDGASVQMLDHLRNGGVRVVRKPHAGPASARNHGLAATDADWVLALEPDDVLDPTYLEQAAACALRNPDAAVVASAMTVHDADLGAARRVWAPLGFDLDLLLFMNVGAPPTCVLNRAGVLAVGGFDETMAGCEDWELWARLAAAGYRACVIPEPLVRHRSRPDGSNRTQPAADEDILKARIMRRYAASAPRPDLALRVEWSEVLYARQYAQHLDRQLGDARRENESLRGTLASMGLGAGAGALPPSVHVDRRAIELLRENYRYRLADSVNNVLKTVRVQRAMKRVVRGIMPGDDTTSNGQPGH